MIPNIPPKLFSLSAIAVGYLLIDESTATEQNALGNWLMLVAQVLSTNAYYKALMQERGREPVETGKNNAYTFSNNKATNAGSYMVTAKLGENYIWDDNTSVNKTFSCSSNNSLICMVYIY